MIGPVLPVSRVAGATPPLKVPRPPAPEPPAGDRIVISPEARDLAERYTRLSRAQRDLFLIHQSIPTPAPTQKSKETGGTTATEPEAPAPKAPPAPSLPKSPPAPVPAFEPLGAKVDILA